MENYYRRFGNVAAEGEIWRDWSRHIGGLQQQQRWTNNVSVASSSATSLLFVLIRENTVKALNTAFPKTDWTSASKLSPTTATQMNAPR